MKPGPRALPREHGTKRGYTQHSNNGEKPCRPCLDAYNAIRRADYAAPSSVDRRHIVHGRMWPRCLEWNPATGQCTERENHDGDCVWSVVS